MSVTQIEKSATLFESDKMTEFAVFCGAIFVIIGLVEGFEVGAYFKQGLFRKPGKTGPWVVASRK